MTDDNTLRELQAQVSQLQASNDQLKWGLTALAVELTKHFPLRNRPPGQDQLNEIVMEIQAQAEVDAADARRRALQKELKALEAAA